MHCIRYVLMGGLGAWIILQCRGIEKSVKEVILNYIFAVENLQLKM